MPTESQKISWVAHIREHIPSQKGVFQRGEEEVQIEFYKAPKQEVHIQNELNLPHVHQTHVSVFKWNLPPTT